MHATRGLVAFPTRSHTISGVGGALRSARAAKSSSLVMTTAPFAQGLCPESIIIRVTQNAFSTCTASWPAAHNHCAKAGGNCASTRILTLRMTIQRDILAERHIAVPLECLPAQGKENFPEFPLRSRRGEHLQNILHANAHAANTGSAPALVEIEGNHVRGQSLGPPGRDHRRQRRQPAYQRRRRQDHLARKLRQTGLPQTPLHSM